MQEAAKCLKKQYTMDRIHYWRYNQNHYEDFPKRLISHIPRVKELQRNQNYTLTVCHAFKNCFQWTTKNAFGFVYG